MSAETDPRRSERGGVLIITALLMVTMVMVAAFVVDLGVARVTGLRLQNHADSGALAGSFELPGDPDNARDVAAEYVHAVLGNTTVPGVACGTDSECYDTAGYTVKVTAPQGDPGRIGVVVCTTTPAFFGRLVGVNELSECRSAEAATANSGSSPACVICVLDATGVTFSSTGAGTVNVAGGAIVINSDNTKALTLTGSGKVTSDTGIGIYGGYDTTPGALSPLPTYSDPVADPFASIPVPSVAGPPKPKESISGSSDLTLSPGVYTEIVSSSSGQITLQPGIYVVTKQIKLSKSPNPGKTSLVANDVLIYFACQNYPLPCAAGESGASLSMSSGTTISWSAPTSGPYQGLSVFFDRLNESTFSLTGSSSNTFTGSIYLKSGVLSMTGPSGVASTMQSQLVAGSIKKTGDSSVDISYNGSLNPPVGGSGTSSRRLSG